MAKKLPKLKNEIGYIKTREITEEMKESYIDYAMSVIISRALPDVRDGLKPVHRRILYSMYEMGLKHDAKSRKSATVVGFCLGRFHPHGDQSVYDAAMRMAQDFSLRYPLIQGQGNVGSIDDPSEFAAMRYCITGDSLVVTNRCLERIGEVSNNEDISLKVLSFNQKINSASKWFNSGIHPVSKIETFRGYSLKGTYNHPILILQKDTEGKPVFKWKLLKDVRRGDFAIIDRSEALWPKKEPSFKKYFPILKRNKYQHPIIHKLPFQMAPDLAFLMGAILAEGYISIGKKNKNYKIGFCNTDREFINKFRLRFKKVFPDCSIYEKERNPLSYGKKKFVAFEICSWHLVEFFKNLGLTATPAHLKRIPEIIFHSTKKSVGEFLKGYFEGDGSIYNSARSPVVNCSSSSKLLLREIQIILLRFGIASSIRCDKTRKEFRLFIRGFKNLNQFKENINFLTKGNINKLQKFSQINSDGKVMAKTDYIPYLSQYIREKYRKKKIKWVDKDWLFRHNLDRYPKLQKYYSCLEKILEKSDLKLIQSFLNNYYLFDPIVSIQKGRQRRVYSLRVDSSCHSFVSNGFVSHNTEMKLAKIGEEMLRDIGKDTVDFVNNYDGTRKEPVVLPSPLPQLLLNGSLGIAVGMATNIPPHNLSEVVDAAIYLLSHPKADTEDLFKFIKGPDFPTGGEIYGQKEEIITAYSQGKGPIVARGKTEIIREKRDKTKIVITEIPFQVQKSNLIKQFAKLVQEKRARGIKDIRDESDKEGLRIVIDLSREAYPRKILNQLYKFTSLQKTFHLNMLALVDGIQPRVLSLADLLNHYLFHRKKVVFRKSKYELEKAKKRTHILTGLNKCLGKIDQVIRTIKASKDRNEAEKNLIKRFKLSKIQAVAILETKLAALAKLERKKIEEELKENLAKIKQLSKILKSPKKIKEIIERELEEVKENFADKRKTKVISKKIGEIALEDLIPQEEAIITLTQGGYIKRINPKSYKIQKRGGKGILGMKTLQEDIVEHFLLAKTHDSLLFFTDSGKVFKIIAYEVPEATRVARGRGLLNFLEISPQEKVLTLLPLSKKDLELGINPVRNSISNGIKYLVMVTQNGIIKKTEISEFENVRKSGLIAISLKKGDSLKKVQKSTGDDEVILVTKRGQAIRFKEKDVRKMGRPASGVKGVRLEKQDEVVGMDIIQSRKSKVESRKLEKQYLLVVTENGYGKRTDLGEYRLQKRGGSGIKTAKLTSKTGDLVFSKLLTTEEDLIVISQKGKVIRTKIALISKLSRITQGVKIMKLEEGDKVASATCI